MTKALTILIWLAVSVVMFAIISLPVSLQVHLVTAAVLILAMGVIKILNLDGN